jgi:3-oxoacyl-[acyl-carrier protein] reductase
MSGTTANSVSVGLTQTDSIMSCPEDLIETFKNEFIPKQNIPQFAQPNDVANVIGMLCSRDARWITGSVVCANGGSVNIG